MAAADRRHLSSLSQVVPCLAASGGLLSSGMTVAFPSAALALSPLSSSHQSPWIGSASHLAMILGSLVVGPLLDSSGRRTGLLVALLFAFIGWTVLSTGEWTVAGRLLTGLSAGLASAPVSVLIAEISVLRLRSLLTTFKHDAFSLGLFLMYCLGLIFKEEWRWSAGCSAGLSLLCLTSVLCCVPETRRTPSSSSASLYLPFLSALTSRPEVYRPFALMSILAALKQLSGTTVVLSYATQLLRAGGLEEAERGAVWIGGVRLVGSLCAAPLAAHFGRRVLATYAGYISSLALMLLASASAPSASLISLLVFVFSSALSSSAIQALVGEVFVSEFRGVSTGLTTTVTYSSAFVALHSHPWLRARLGFSRLLGLYATASVLATLLAICCLQDKAHTGGVGEGGGEPGKAADGETDPEVTFPLTQQQSTVLKDHPLNLLS